MSAEGGSAVGSQSCRVTGARQALGFAGRYCGKGPFLKCLPQNRIFRVVVCAESSLSRTACAAQTSALGGTRAGFCRAFSLEPASLKGGQSEDVPFRYTREAGARREATGSVPDSCPLFHAHNHFNGFFKNVHNVCTERSACGF